VIRSIPVVIMPVRALAVRAGRGGLWPGAEAGGDRVEPLADGRLALVALWLCAVCSGMALLLSGVGTGAALSAAVSGASGPDAPLRVGGAWALAGAQQGRCQLLVSEAAGRRGDLGAVGGRRAGACMTRPARCPLGAGL